MEGGREAPLSFERGLKATGLDGDASVMHYGNVHDFTTGPPPMPPGMTYDLAWSVEFLEHVEEQFIPNYMAAFQRCKYALVTAAPPGAPGHHHVNCQDGDYWVDVFKKYGFEHDPRGSIAIHNASTIGRNFMRETGMLFKRGD
jgi:hypothetical protein